MSTLTPLEAITLEIEDRVAIARLRASYTLRLMYQLGRMSSAGQTILKWDVDLGGGAAAVEAVTANGAATATDVVKNASLPIGNYRIKHQFPLSKIKMREAANTAPSELRNLFAAHIDRGISAILRSLNAYVFTGDGTAGTAELTGLAAITDNTANYAGLSPVTYPLWQTYNNANGGTARALTRALLYDIDEQTVNLESNYDAIIVTPRTATKYKNLFDTSRPLEFLYDNEGNLPNADVGLSNLSYNGKPIIQDPMCTAGTMYFLDMLEMELQTFAVANGPDPSMGLEENPIDVATARLLGLNINVAELPSSNSAVRVFEMYVLPQLVVRNRKAIKTIKDLQTT